MTGNIADRIEGVAKALYGEANPRLSTKDELRFGSNGSLAVHLNGEHRGTWRDHEAGAGGGVLDLIAHKIGGDRANAAAWLRDNIEGGRAPVNDSGKVTAVYRYVDRAGELVHEVVRLEPKSFRQRRPDGAGGYRWNMKGVPPLLYNLPRVIEAAERGELVIVVEGEKDADRLNSMGLVATCNAGGAGKWKPEHSAQLAGARVAIIPDNDEAGRDHAEQVALATRDAASEVKTVPLDVAERKGDASDWIEAGGTADKLVELIEAAPVWRPSFKPRFPVIWFGQEDAAAPLRWLVRGLLSAGGLSVVFGAPKSSKTFAAIDIALHVAHGRDWYGLRTRGGGVAYISGEGQAGVRQRMKAWRQEFEGEPGAPFALIPQSINLFDDPDELDRLIADLQGMAIPMGGPVELVVLDTLSRMIGSGDEDKARDVNVVVRSAERIQRMTGAHVMIVHHSGKDRDRGMRGSNALLGAVDAAIEVTKDADTGLCEAKVTAIKDGEAIGPFAYTLRQTAVGTDDEGEEIVTCVIDPAGASQGVRTPKLSDPERRCLAVLKELCGNVRDTAGQSPFVPIATWRDTFRDREDGSFDARKKRAERATKALIDKGLAEPWGDRVCLAGEDQ
ncbi:AAA family ATPase [Alteriqipengyuania lutimaris]|uniref:AAA family ATPase n=1 Tax=Alteriqipengyuania lutimaris TaxID=1538146 RepID=UPI001CFEA002|nr:AAA family ATPase [Alteriqipengyuania lutimaris]